MITKKLYLSKDFACGGLLGVGVSNYTAQTKTSHRGLLVRYTPYCKKGRLSITGSLPLRL